MEGHEGAKLNTARAEVGRAKGHRQESKLAPKKYVRPSAFCLWGGWARGWSHRGSYLGSEIFA